MNESAALNASDNSAEAEEERLNVEKYLVPVVFGLIFVVVRSATAASCSSFVATNPCATCPNYSCSIWPSATCLFSS
jgi:hypothetical protein